jgi:hypothetical protein
LQSTALRYLNCDAPFAKKLPKTEAAGNRSHCAGFGIQNWLRLQFSARREPTLPTAEHIFRPLAPSYSI